MGRNQDAEGYAKPAPKSRRQSSGTKPGGQNGHDGSMTADQIVKAKKLRVISSCEEQLALQLQK